MTSAHLCDKEALKSEIGWLSSAHASSLDHGRNLRLRAAAGRPSGTNLCLCSGRRGVGVGGSQQSQICGLVRQPNTSSVHNKSEQPDGGGGGGAPGGAQPC